MCAYSQVSAFNPKIKLNKKEKIIRTQKLKMKMHERDREREHQIRNGKENGREIQRKDRGDF